MKKCVSVLIVVLSLLLLVQPANATDDQMKRLKSIYQNLTTYVTPYYKDSIRYPEYEAAMNELKGVIELPEPTPMQMDQINQKVLAAYSSLIRTEFDFSKIELLESTYNAIDSNIFTDGSFADLSEAMENIKAELASPTLFGRSDATTDERYQQSIDSQCLPLYQNFIRAFSKLEFNLPQENISRPLFDSFVGFVRLCTSEEVMKNASTWETYNKILLEGENLVTWTFPAQWRLDNCVKDLLVSYQTITFEIVDYTELMQLTAKAQTLTPTDYSAKSWQSYCDVLASIQESINRPHHFYSLNGDPETYRNSISFYLSEMTEPLKATYDRLIPAQKYDELKSLCKKYTGIEKVAGYELKWEDLKKSVENAELLLMRTDATLPEVETLINEIKTRGEAYLFSINSSNDQKMTESENVVMIRRVVIACAVSLFLSLVFAMILSWLKFRRFNWFQ